MYHVLSKIIVWQSYSNSGKHFLHFHILYSRLLNICLLYKRVSLKTYTPFAPQKWMLSHTIYFFVLSTFCFYHISSMPCDNASSTRTVSDDRDPFRQNMDERRLAVHFVRLLSGVYISVTRIQAAFKGEGPSSRWLIAQLPPTGDGAWLVYSVQ